MIAIRPWTKEAAPAEVEALEALFTELYTFMGTKGLSHPLVPDGARSWYASMQPMLGRLTFIHGAWEGEQLVGFVAGLLRNLPAYVGGARMGSLTHIHVSERVRGMQVGERLFHALSESFRAGKAERMEVDVLVANTAAHGFFERMGCTPHHTILHHKLA